MKKPVQSLRGRGEFVALKATRATARSGPVRCRFVPTAGTEVCIGFAIGRRQGSAVVRNRIRRRIRAVVATMSPVRPGNYLLSADGQAAVIGFQQLHTHVESVLAAVAAS